VQALADFSATLKFLFIALTVAGVALTLYAAWRGHRTRQAERGDAIAHVPAEAAA
jgi:hypothetical protein